MIESLPFTITESNSGATGDVDDGAVTGCGFFSPVRSSVWYTLEGDGNCVLASITSNTRLSLFVLEGDCGDLVSFLCDT